MGSVILFGSYIGLDPLTYILSGENYLGRSIFRLLTGRLAFFSLTFESQYQINMF